MQNKKVITFVFSAILISIVGRLIPHLPNFTPLVAVTLFSGFVFNNKFKALLLALTCMVVSDFATITIINSKYLTLSEYFSSTSTLFIYLPIVAIALIGSGITNIKFPKIAGLGFASSLLFWISSNFGVWLVNSGFYPSDFSGLTTCYIAAIPFLGYQIAGDVFYSLLVFGFAKFSTTYFNSIQTSHVQ
jgi:hypothetical protein